LISLALLAAVSLDAAAIARTSATLNALGPHPFGSPRNQAAAQFVAAKLTEAGLSQTALDSFLIGDTEGVNVVARLAGRSDRLLIVATHHDSPKDAGDGSDRSRSLSVLLEMARVVKKQPPAKTWILASFDGGEAGGEGLAHYLDSLGPSRGLVDGVVLINASPNAAAAKEPAVVVPACASDASAARVLASRDLVAAALDRLPEAVNVSFDDPGISLLTQPFIRTFKTPCPPSAGRALGGGLGVVMVSDTSYSGGFLPRTPGAPDEAPARDEAAARLASTALAVIDGIDGSAFPSPQSDSWLVVGRSVMPGWVLFGLGLICLVPGLVSLRSEKTRLALRTLYSATFIVVLFFEPEVALFAGLLPALAPPSASRSVLSLSLAPLALLVGAGILGFFRGQVTGSWLSIWLWIALLGGPALLYLAKGSARKSGARGKRGKR